MVDWRSHFAGEALSAHDSWLMARSGPGRLVVEGRRLRGAVLAGAALQGVRLVGCDLTGVDLVEANLSEAELEDCGLTGANLRGVCLSDAMVTRCDVADADLIGADLRGIRVRGGRWRQATLTEADVRKAEFGKVEMPRVGLEQTRLYRAGFLDCLLSGACLAGADATHTTFARCDLRNVDVDELVLDDTFLNACGFAGTTGRPFVLGDYYVVEPDLSPAFDGTGRADPEVIGAQWGGPEAG